MSLADNRFTVLDCETFGLDPERDPIIEVGIIVATLDFRTVARFSTTVWEPGFYDTALADLKRRAAAGDKGANIVLKMHTDSGLWDEAKRDGVPIQDAVQALLDFCLENQIDGEDPLVGSTIGFDRGMLKFQMPQVEAKFHYRDINISSVKELCRRYNPSVYSEVNTAWIAKKAHRVLDDCDDSLRELQFYYENFLFTEV